MPSSIVKLSAYDARAWSANAPSWLDPDGSVAGPVSREEQQAISRVLEKSARMQTSFRQTVPLLPFKRQGRRSLSTAGKHTPLVEFAFEITFVGSKRVVTVYKGEQRYATGRDILSARLLADHGECVLHGRNGKCIGVLRDPFVESRAPNLGRRVQWSHGRSPNVDAGPDQRESGQTAPRPRKRMPVVRRAVMPNAPTPLLDAVAPTARRVAREPDPVLPTAVVKAPVKSPDECPHDCRGRVKGGNGWSLADDAVPPGPNQHHPFCPHAEAWNQSQGADNEDELVLYDIETARVMRPALPNEITEAQEAESRMQMPNVVVQDRVYSVLPRKFAEQAAAEARGELESEPSDIEASPEGDEPEPDEHEADTIIPAAAVTADARNARSEWPTLEALQRRGGDYRANAEITARDYLTRRPGTTASP